MKNYYEILNIQLNSTFEQIKEAYKFKISRFQNLPFLTEQMKKDIKILKEAKFILFDKDRRIKYDIKNFSKNSKKEKSNNTIICDRIFNL